MATAFAQNYLDVAQSTDGDSMFKMGARRRNSVRAKERHINRRASMSSIKEGRNHQVNMPCSAEVLTKNEKLWNQFKSDLSLTGSCTGAGAKAMLHDFVSNKMKEDPTETSSSSVASAPGKMTSGGGVMRKRMSNLGGQLQRRLSISSLVSTFALEDECVSSSSQASNKTSQDEVLVEFDHVARRHSSIARRNSASLQVQRQTSSSSVVTDLTMEAAVQIVSAELANMPDDDDYSENGRTNNISFQKRRCSIGYSTDGISCLDSVVSGSEDDVNSDDDSDDDDDFSCYGASSSDGSFCHPLQDI